MIDLNFVTDFNLKYYIDPKADTARNEKYIALLDAFYEKLEKNKTLGFEYFLSKLAHLKSPFFFYTFCADAAEHDNPSMRQYAACAEMLWDKHYGNPMKEEAQNG